MGVGLQRERRTDELSLRFGTPDSSLSLRKLRFCRKDRKDGGSSRLPTEEKKGEILESFSGVIFPLEDVDLIVLAQEGVEPETQVKIPGSTSLSTEKEQDEIPSLGILVG